MQSSIDADVEDQRRPGEPQQCEEQPEAKTQPEVNATNENTRARHKTTRRERCAAMNTDMPPTGQLRQTRGP